MKAEGRDRQNSFCVVAEGSLVMQVEMKCYVLREDPNLMQADGNWWTLIRNTTA